MKIIDKRIDYYDGVARSFRDEEPVYVRTSTTSTVPMERTSPFSVLGFCGRVYPFHELNAPVRGRVINYDRDSAVETVVAGLERPRGGGKWIDYWHRGRTQYLSSLWDQVASKTWEEQFSRAPIWVIRHIKRESSEIEFNPLLRQFGFYKIAPPAQAFQELSMWLSNQARPMKPMPIITDELKAQSKGFDKHSFRGFDRRE